MVKLAPEKSDGNSELESAPGSSAVPVMTGTHFHVLDEKGRVIIPAKLRPALTERFWLMPDENDNIGIFPYQTGLDILHHCENMTAERYRDENVAAAVERITSRSEEVNVEGGWRVQVPDLLRLYAHLDKDIVIVGRLNHAVMWDRTRWEEAQMRQQSAEVRRLQAEIMRAAASGVRRTEVTKVAEPVEQIDVAATVAGTGGGTESAGAANKSRAAAASAGDGKRSARILTLSQLGR